MPEPDNVFVRELTRLIEPLRAAVVSARSRDALLAEVGWSLGALSGFPLDRLSQDLQTIQDDAQALVTAVEHPPESLDEVLSLLGDGKELFAAITDLADVLRNSSISDLPNVDQFGTDLLDALIAEYLQSYHPVLLAVGRLLTIIRDRTVADLPDVQVDASSGAVVRFPRMPPTLQLETLVDFLTDPIATLKSEYLPSGSLTTVDDARVLTDRLFPRVAQLLTSLNVLKAVYLPNPRARSDFWPAPDSVAGGFLVLAYPIISSGIVQSTSWIVLGISPAELGNYGLVCQPDGAFDLQQAIGGWNFEVMINAGLPAFAVGPNGVAFPDGALTAEVGGSIAATLPAGDGGRPAVLVGGRTSTHIEVASVGVRLLFVFAQSTKDVGIEATVEGGKLIIASGEGDGFLQRLLPSDPIAITFDMTLGWSTTKGFYVSGGAGFEYTFPINKELGPFFINTIDLGMYLDQGGLNLMTAITGGANIGPVSATVRKIGLTAEIQFGKPGVLGKADLVLAFKPPSGVGLAVAADPVSGGGSLTIEPPIYFGALQLSINDTIGITAFALIATKLPDGSDGFSMVIEIIAEFSPVQLSMGFALTGVGGLLAINRQMSQSGLVSAFKSHALNFLFPRTGVKDAALIQQSLEGIFPIQLNRYVIGPMVQIIWGGTVKLVTFQIGIFIEFGGSVRIAIIGQARAALPNPDAPILVLNLDVLGFIDCGNETLAIDGGLFDSSLLSRFKLTGGMAVRAGWGDDNSSFALAVGGFHPRYTPPPNFPVVARLAITLGDGNPHLSLSTYFAVTTNTIQLGALLDLYASKAGFVITAGLGFDAIVIFHPFYFEFATHAWASVSMGRTELVGISLALVLSGPNPLHATGTAKFTVLFVKIKAHFDETFGDSVGDQAPVVSPLDRLIVELNDVRNLRSELPAWASDGVVLTESDSPLLDPVGTIVFAQNAVPLNITMDRFGGGAPPADERLLNLELLLATDGATTSLITGSDLPSLAKTQFAPEQFHNWTAEQKLSAPAFEEYECGLRQEAEFCGLDEASFERTTVSFETIIHESSEYVPPSPPGDPERGHLAAESFFPDGTRLRGWAGQGASRLFAGLRTVRNPNSPGYVSLTEPTYCACSQETTNGKFNTLPGATRTTYVSALPQTSGASPGSAVLLESAFASEEAPDA